MQHHVLNAAILDASRQNCGLVHGDLTGDNLFILPDGGYKLIDWARPFRGPTIVDLAALLESLGHDPLAYVDRPALTLLYTLRINWLTQCSPHAGFLMAKRAMTSKSLISSQKSPICKPICKEENNHAMTSEPIQNFYPGDTAVCYGCGRNNEHGLHIQTYWDGTEGICHFTPRPYHTAFPGVVYGGLLASVIDCHSIGTAIAAMYSAEQREPSTEPLITCVTGKLNVDYLKPTPTDTELLLRTRIAELSERKAIVTCSVYAASQETVRARGSGCPGKIPARQ